MVGKSSHPQRRVRCSMHPCPLRGRVRFDERRYCKYHAQWCLKFHSFFKVWMSEHAYVPPSFQTRLGKWHRRQLFLHRNPRVARLQQRELTPRQLHMLRGIPNWDVTCRTAKVAYRRDLE